MEGAEERGDGGWREMGGGGGRQGKGGGREGGMRDCPLRVQISET